jgi:diadenosine tetraphosphatase ApaH/serine/threonine PP2A family protein phosphatase
LVEQRSAVCLCGNHDLAVRGTIDTDEFAGDAGAAAAWTRTVLSAEAKSFLDSLEPSGKAEGAALFHGSARDPVWEYVLSDESAVTTLLMTDEPVVLVGHSHVALEVRLDDATVEGGLAPGGTELELGDARWLLNPGSVGQPRDGDPRAAYLLLDRVAGSARFCRVEYDVERTQADMRAAHLPAALAARLALGQ